jgi:hypothetical protein
MGVCHPVSNTALPVANPVREMRWVTTPEFQIIFCNDLQSFVDLHIDRVRLVPGSPVHEALRFGHGQIQVKGRSGAILEAQFQCIAAFEQPGWIISGKESSQQPLEGHMPLQALQICTLPRLVPAGRRGGWAPSTSNK